MEPSVALEIFVTERGRKPFIEWLHALDDVKARALIRTRLNRLRLGHFGDCNSVGNSVYELRIDYGPGYRIYFGRAGIKVILLLCAGTKRSQDRDIERAKRYWKTHLEES
jgi:putative addiction module killer protein